MPVFAMLQSQHPAAFTGNGRVFVRYSPPALIARPPPLYLCSMRDRPVLIENGGSEADWLRRDVGSAVSRALAAGSISLAMRGATLAVSDADTDLALEYAKGPVEWLPRHRPIRS